MPNCFSHNTTYPFLYALPHPAITEALSTPFSSTMEIFAREEATGITHPVDVGEKLTFTGLKKELAATIPIKAREMVLSHAGVTLGDDYDAAELVASSAVAAGDEILVAQDTTNIKELLQSGNAGLEAFPPWVRNDRELVLAAIAADAEQYSNVGEPLCLSEEIIIAALDGGLEGSHLREKDIWNNRNIVLAIVKENAHYLGFAAEEIRKDKQLCLDIVPISLEAALFFAHKSLRKDPDFMYACIVEECQYESDSDDDEPDDSDDSDSDLCTTESSEIDTDFLTSNCMQCADDVLKGDIAFMKKAAKVSTRCLVYAKPCVLENAEIMLPALLKRPSLVPHVPRSLLDNDDFMKQVLIKRPALFSYASDALKADIDFALKLLRLPFLDSPLVVLSHLPDDVFQSRRLIEIVLEDEDDSEALMFCAMQNSTLSKDADTMCKALNMDPDLFVLVDPSLKKDKTFALRVVAATPTLFLKFPYEVREEHDVAMLYVADARLLDGVGYALRQDRTFALAAVNVSGMLLAQLPTFENDADVVLAAVSQTKAAIKHAGAGVRGDAAFMILAAHASAKVLGAVTQSLLDDVDFCVNVANEKEMVPHLPRVSTSVAAAVLERLEGDSVKHRFDTCMSKAGELQNIEDFAGGVSCSRYAPQDSDSDADSVMSRSSSSVMTSSDE